LIGSDFGKAVLSAIALLLVACPCAMGLATPVAIMVGSGRASALGILVRGGDILELLAKADMVVFDKTGTLTESHARVTEVLPLDGVQREHLLGLASAVESETTHPIGLAIRSVGGVLAMQATGTVELPGQGVRGVVGTSEVEVVKLGDAELPPSIQNSVSLCAARGETIVVVRQDGEVIGAIALSTPVRNEAAAAIAHLHSMGIATAVLSGDGHAAVQSVADQLGIRDVQSGLSASEKVDAIRELQKSGRRVVMVGDGINDAPALAAADVGCAIGSGTDAALANSGLALMGNDLEGVPAAIGLARSTLAIVRENLGWAMGYNISAIPLAAAGLLDPLIAAIAMGVSSLVVVLNSLRLMRFGRSGLDKVRPPLVMRGVRGFVLSVAIPVVLFAGATVAGQEISPARGQALLPSAPNITDVNVVGGGVAEVYLDPGSAGVNGFHLIFEKNGSAEPVGPVLLTGSRDGGGPQPMRIVRLSTGHFASYGVLAAGKWRFSVSTSVNGAQVSFTVDRTLS
jgi:Cu+-exporting ATPase